MRARTRAGWRTSAPYEPPERRATDQLLFFFLAFPGLQLHGIPASELAMTAAAGLALTRRADPSRPVRPWLAALLALLVTWSVISALIVDIHPYRRLLHLALYAALVFLMAQGRFAMASVGRGLALGVTASGLAWAAGVGVGYTGRLAGYFGDPNAAGFYALALGAVAVAFLPANRWRTAFIGLVLALVALTLSRTSLLAVGIGAVWVLAGRRLRPVPNLALASVLIYTLTRIADALRNWGPFAGRTGSDDLRTRIVILERIKVDAASWHGNGPGTSTIQLVTGQRFFFHSSYLGLWNELGVIGVAIVLPLLVGSLLTASQLPQHRRNLWLEGGIVAVATCAVNLGEVLLELPTAVLLGALAFHVAGVRATESPEPEPESEPEPEPESVPQAESGSV